MILAKLTKAIREQNYYAVVLEFLIVIAGVVIGFQITAWNESRAEVRQGEVYLDLIADELTIQTLDYEVLRRMATIILRDIDYVEGAIDDPDSVGDDPLMMPRALLRSRYTSYTPIPRTVYDGLEGSGDISLIQNQEIVEKVRQHYRMIESWKESLSLYNQIPNYRAAIAGYLTSDQMEAVSRDGYRSHPVFEDYTAEDAVNLARQLAQDPEIARWLPEVHQYHVVVRNYAEYAKEDTQELLLEIRTSLGQEVSIDQELTP